MSKPTREDLVKIARDAAGGLNSPPEWVIEAMQRAYERGSCDGYRRCVDTTAQLYPEGG